MFGYQGNCDCFPRGFTVSRGTVTVRPYSPWVTEEIAIEKRKRRALERRWRSTGLPSDYRSFVFQCDVVNSLLQAAKTSFYRDVIESSNHDQRVLFETVDKLIQLKLKLKLVILHLLRITP